MFLMFQSSSASLGSLALYRSSIQSVVYTVGNLVNTARMAFQGIFFMGAFCAAMNIEPRLTPVSEDAELYPSIPNGMKIEARYLKPSIVYVYLPSISATEIYHIHIQEARSHRYKTSASA